MHESKRTGEERERTAVDSSRGEERRGEEDCADGVTGSSSQTRDSCASLLRGGGVTTVADDRCSAVPSPHGGVTAVSTAVLPLCSVIARQTSEATVLAWSFTFSHRVWQVGCNEVRHDGQSQRGEVLSARRGCGASHSASSRIMWRRPTGRSDNTHRWLGTPLSVHQDHHHLAHS